MKYLLILCLLISCNTLKDIKTDKTTSSSLKDDGGKIKSLAEESKVKATDIKAETRKKSPNLNKIGDSASSISSDQEKILMLSDNVIKNSDFVKAKDEVIEKLNKENAGLKKDLDSKRTKIFWILGAIFLVACVYCFYAHNIWAGICCFGGVLSSVAVTWFIHHAGVIFGAIIAISIGYLALKHRKKVKDELFETVEHYKDSLSLYNEKDNTRKIINRIQSADTKAEIKKIKNKRDKKGL